MAKKVILKDLNDIEVLPITRGELVLDASGNLALHSTLFLATDSLPGLMSSEDKYKLDHLEESGPGANNKVAQINTTTNDVYRLLFSETADDTDRTEGARKSAKLLFNPSTGALTATALIGKLDWSNLNDVPEDFTPAQHIHNTSEITALTSYSKASSASDLVTTDTLNVALGKLEYKADTAYNFYKSITGSDNDEIINKWEEIVDFVDSVKEDSDIIDEFVTRKTGQTITGVKTFSTLLKFTVDLGTSPFIVSSTTKVDNLNADLLDGKHATDFMQYSSGGKYVQANLINSELWSLAGGNGYIEYYDSGTWFNSLWGKVTAHYGFEGSLSGNATSATKLQTARTIWGLSFDGSSDVDGNLKIIVDVASASVADSALEIHNTGTYAGPKLINAYSPNLPVSSSAANGVHLMFGVKEASYDAAYIKFWYAGAGSTNNAIRFGFHTSDNLMAILANGNVGIGTTSPDRALHVVGGSKLEGTNCILSFATDYSDTWSDGTNTHPWYGYDHRYSNTGVFSTVISDYYGMTLKTVNCNLSMTLGCVGIGTYNPQSKLDVNGEIYTNPYIRFVDSQRYCGYFANGKYLELYNGVGGVGIHLSDDGNAYVYKSGTRYTIIHSGNYSSYLNGTYLRKVTVANNTTNDFNTFENMTLTGRGDPVSGASLSNAPWTGSGPTGGYGVLTYLWSGYGTQMAWGYNSNRIYIRNKYYTNSTSTWSSTWQSLALVGESYTKSEADSRYINAAGDTMTGILYLGDSKHYLQYYTGGKYVEMYNATASTGIGVWDTGEAKVFNYSGLYKIWHEGNDGSGSGLDADTVDGIHASSLSQIKYIGFTGDYCYDVILLCKRDEVHHKRLDGTLFTTGEGRNRYHCADVHFWHCCWVIGSYDVFNSVTNKAHNSYNFQFCTCTYGGAVWYAIRLCRILAVSYYFMGSQDGINFSVITYYHTNNGVLNSEIYNSISLINSNNMRYAGDIYANHFYESSDIALKDNVKAIINSDNIPQLKSFDWKSDGSHSYGLIALELEEMGYPELVSSSGSYKTVNYSAALSLIVGKLQVKIKELEKEIEILKNKN